MSATRHLHLPLSEDAVRTLKIGDMVYVDGELVMTAGLPTHERILKHLQSGTPLPLNMHGSMLLQFGGYSREVNGKVELLYLNPTTSTRFNALMPPIIRGLGLRAVGGKGGLSAECARAMQESGCVYLSFPGGGCTLYTASIRDLLAVHWEDLILQYRLMKIRVESLGPATVGIDAHGNSLYDSLQVDARRRLPEIMAMLNAERDAHALNRKT